MLDSHQARPRTWPWILAVGVVVVGVIGAIAGYAWSQLPAGPSIPLDGWTQTPPTPLVIDGTDVSEVWSVGITKWSAERTPENAERVLKGLDAFPGMASALRPVFRAGAQVPPTSDLAVTVDRFNEAAEAAGAPLVLHAGSFRDQPYLKSYVVVAEVPMSVGERQTRARLMSRVDTLNIREGRTGSTSIAYPEQGGTVLVDRVLHQTLREMLPLLRADAPEVHAESVRLNVAEQLGPEALERLAELGELRVLVDQSYRAIATRGQDCQTVRINPPEWYGYPPQTLSRIRAWAAADDPSDPCARVTPDEATALEQAFAALVADENTLELLGQLAALNARGTALHEARHAMDAQYGFGDGEPPALDADAMLEASAYLATLRDPVVAPMEWAVMCKLADAESRSPHARAVNLIASELGACSQPVPSGLSAAATALDAAWFGERPNPQWPSQAPDVIEIRGWQRAGD